MANEIFLHRNETKVIIYVVILIDTLSSINYIRSPPIYYINKQTNNLIIFSIHFITNVVRICVCYDFRNFIHISYRNILFSILHLNGKQLFISHIIIYTIYMRSCRLIPRPSVKLSMRSITYTSSFSF